MKRVYAKTTAAAVGAVAAVAVTALLSGAQAQGLDAARQMIEEHRAKPVFSAPGPAFDAKSCAAGKRVLTIPCLQREPVHQEHRPGNDRSRNRSRRRSD